MCYARCMGLLKDDFPELVKEWSLNNTLDLETITSGSTKKALWICHRGHEYSSTLYNKTNKKGCPFCSGHKALAGYNDLFTTHPHLKESWSPKNTINPLEISAGSNRKILWVCDLKHEYLSTPAKRTIYNTNCPYCTGKRVLEDFNDLATTHPELVKEWSPNNIIKPTEISAGSEKKVLWLCNLGHEYEANPYGRIRLNSNCSFCSNQKVLPGFNDLATTRPDLLAYWSPNNTIKPTEVTSGSNKIVLWVCPLGHEHKHKIYDKSKSNVVNCSICDNRRLLVGFNDVASRYPDLINEWSEKNILLPTEVIAGGHKKYWRKCLNGHEDFKQSIHYWPNHGCSKCTSIVSSLELELAEFIKGLGYNIEQSNRKILNGLELDIYIPDIRVGIEFNGKYWHSEKFPEALIRDKNKIDLCKRLNVLLLTVYEQDWLKSKQSVKQRIIQILSQA